MTLIYDIALVNTKSISVFSLYQLDVKKRIKKNHNNLFPVIAILLLLVSKSYAESTPSWGRPLVDTDYSACDIDAGDDKNICAGSSVILTTSVSSIVTYSWSPTTGLDDPSAANPVASPSSTTTYTVTVDDGAGCIGSDDVIVTVDDLPVISVATSISICQGQTTNETASATGASPFVYEWDGPSSGATLTATPTTTTLYTLIVTDALGCSSSALVTVNVDNLPTVTLVLDEAQVCQDASTVTLTGGSPLDGTYSGAFVTGSTFDVAAAGLGFHTITYSYTDANECEAIATQDLEVVEGPTVTFDLDIDNVCNDINTVIFEGGQPTGGSYSGSFVSGNSFDVSAAGQGTHTITYTYVNGAGCTDVATDDMIVFPLPVVSLTLSQQSFCTDDPIFALDGSSPSGGVYSGTGVTDNNFDPSLAGIGTHTLTYTYVDEEGCEGAATQDVIVYGSPSVTFSPSLTEICMNSPAYTLDGVSPVGGTFSGVGVEGSQLDPSAVVGQSTLVTYTYTDPNGCTASAVAEIFLTPMATISEVTVMDDLCDQGEGTLTVCYQDLSTTEQVQLSLDGGITWEAPISGCEIQLSSLPLTTVPGQGTALGTFIEGGTSISLDDNTWNVLEMNYNITANTVLTFEFASTVQGEEHSIGFSDQNTVASIDDNRFKLYGTAGPGGPYISGFDYTGGGSFQSFSIPIGDYLSGTVNYLALVNEDNTGSGNSIWRNIIIAESDEACITKQAASVTYTGLAAGNYDLQMRSPDGTCLIDLTDQTIGTIYNTVAADAGLDAEVCQGDPHTFTATGGVSYLWNDPAETASANLTVSPSVSTTYVVTVTDSEGCTGTDEVLLTVSSTTVTFSETQDFFCTDDTTLTLTGGQPAGGVYSGAGVTSGVFDPMAAGVGAHILTYTYTDDCTYTVDFSVNVVQSPTATLSLIDDLACISEIGLTLEGGVPAGGQYSGVGVSNGNYLDVQLAGVGVHEITYTYTDPTNGCTATATQDFTITELPTVELILVQDEVCFNNTMMVLDGGSPAGGVYSGAGVDGTNFNPSETFPGLVTIGYTYQDANGCESIAYAGVTVHSGPTVSLDIEPSQVCINALATGLSGGQPAGGVYSGTGVEDGNFDPAVAGLGTHTITYTYIDTDGCEDSVVDQIEVINPQAVSLSLPDTEICEDVAGLNLSGGLPQGGSYSGPGVSGNYFDIAIAGAGTHTITYTLVDPNGCENSATQDITIYDLPEVELDFIQTTACYNDESFALGGGTPAGGTYSGPGVVDNNFDPSMAFVGTVTIAYTYTDPTTGCTNNAISNIEVQDIPTVTLSLSTPFVCVTETSVTLQGGAPSNGTYSGPGVTDGVFDATAVGTGSYPITYTVTNANGCTETATEDIQVSDPAIATLNLVQSVICSNAASLVLSGGSPSGGNYSGTGVTNNSFDAMVAGVGLHTITYNVIDPSTGCEGFATQDIEVVAAPTVTMDIPEEHICIYNSTVTLTGASPSGGVWTGAGVTGNNFDATSAGAGIHIITYTYTDDNGCTVATTDQLEVHERPEVTLNLLDDTACVYDTNHPIGEGLPAGGTYSGTGVSGSNFDPSQAGVGTHIITYTVVDVYGCENSASQEITVVEPPLVSINMTEVNFCFGEDNIVLNASPAGSGGTWSGSGISGNTFNTTSSGIGTFTLTYTFVDASGCEAFDTQEVVVTDLPTVTLELAQDEACITGGSFDLVIIDSGGDTPSCVFNNQPGLGFDIGSGGGQTYVVGTDRRVYHWVGTNWTVLPGTPSANRIDVTSAGVPWIITTNSDILFFENNGWTQVSGAALDIACGANEIFIIGTNNAILRRVGNSFSQLPSGLAQRIDVDSDGNPWVVGLDNLIYQYINNAWSARSAEQTIDVGIDSENGHIWALETSGQLLLYTGNNTWENRGGLASNVTASDNIVWLINSNSRISTYQCTSGATPPGGWYTGPGVSGTTFDPSVAGLGDHTITYHYEDANGCVNTATDILTVFPEPVVTIDLEDDEVCINEIITLEDGQPAGGTWSGTGVAGNEFDASIAGAGTHTITYVYDLANCSVSATTEIVVYALPVLVLDIQSSVACEGDILALDASPSGGDWSGPGIANGQMNTAISGPGTHTITYSYTDANGCEASEPVDILVHPETDVTLSLATTQICIHDDPITLTGGAPAGGTFTGPGVSGGVFDPAVASTGLHTITYNLTDANGCIYTASQNIRVVDAPSVSLDLVSDDACQSDDPEVLRGGSPIGGTWDGPGVSGNMIDPDIAGVGVHTITYTVIGNNGCSATATDTYEVYPDGSVELALTDDSFCIGESGIILDGGTPSGGEYSGPGVNSNTGTLNTVIAGVGTHTIEYFFRDGNGCSGFATDEITIYDIPAVTYRAPIDLVCSTEAAFALTGGAPAGGTYSGPGVSGGIFDPMAAGAGYHTITYTYVDTNGCQSVDTDEILVEMPPVVTFVIDDDHCGLNVGAINFEFQDVSGVSLIQFSVNGGITWSQDVDDDTGSVSFNSLSSGDYDLLVRNSSGACELDLGTVTIQNISAPNANAGSDQSIVPPGSAQLSGSGGLSFSWSPSTGLDDPSSPNPIASPQETTTYTLVVTDEYGCTDSDDVVVTVVPPCGGIIGQGDYPYRESFESGFGLWTQEVISDDFDWIIENGFPGPSNASDGSMYAFAGCEGCAGAVGATAVVTSTSVIDPNNALGLPDGSFARVYNSNSTVTLDLGTTLPTGTNIFITWRRKTSYAPGAFADMIVEQSSNATNWIEHSVRPSTSSQNFITTTLSLETPTRYIRVWEETGVNDDFDLDAIVTISGSSDLTGILKSPCFNLVDESCAQVTFDYNMNGQTSGWFSLEVSNDFGQSWTDLGTYVADGSSSWTTEIVDLFSYIDEVNVQLRFITELDGSIGYAIDNFEAITTGCGCDDTSSPFEAFNLVPDPQPFSIDIDCDGDADMLAGGDGELFFFENNGDNTYTDRTGTAQDIMPPLSFLDMTIGFVDLDGDGDKDLSVVGNEPFNKYFYWNTGSKTNPVFTEAGTGGTPANPISGFDLEALDGTIWVGYADATIFWADLDRDGDYDAVVGGKLGWFHYYENQGSETTPNLVRQFGANNPFNGLRADGADEGNGIVQYESAPFLTDWDGDGDLDMFSGNQIATVQYFENIGTATDPVFVEVIGDNNPFDGVIFSEDSHLSIVDEDCDNDWDVFYGVGDTPEDAEATVCDLLVAVPNIAIANSSQDHYCIGETVFLFEQSQSGVSWLWTGPNGFTSTEQNPIITDITEAGAGTYNVEVTNDQGCEFMSSIDITVSEASADAGPDFCIELGETTQLQGSGMGTDFLWIPSAGLTNPTILNPFSSPTNSTTYTLTVTDEFGCSATDDMLVIVKAPECIYGEEIFHADFETTTGDNFWSITNGANDGNFIIGVPNPYGTLGVQMELPAQQGDNTLLTGNGFSQDLDGFAATSASSRDIVLPSDAISLNIGLYWYFSHFRNSSASDYFTLEIRDSGNNAVLFDLIDIVGAPTERPASWSFLSVDISSLIGETVYIYAEGRDAAGGSKLEIALDQIVITGNYSTVATLTLPEVDFCENLDPIELTGGEPAGGTYGGTGVSTDGFFDPQIAGAGTHTIFYEYSENVGCTAIASTAITVFEVPDVDIALAVGEACVNETAIGLFGGSPSGGTYSGPGVTGAAIDPSMAGVGVHTITYTITDDNGCENSITDEFEVFAIPLIISVDSQNALCDSGNGTITVEIDPTASPMGAEISIDGGSTWSTIDATANGIYTATDLLAGDYSVWIRNIDSTCPTEIENVTIVNEPGPAVSIGDDLQICGSGSSFNVVALTEFGTAPLTIDWQGPDGFMASGTDIDIENPGQYSVVVTDANNCIATDTMELIFFTITSFVDIQDETCFGFRDGSLSVFASGAQPINYNLVGEEINTTGQFDNLASGQYQIIVEDANGCTLTQEYTIAGPVELVCAPDSCVRNITQEWSGAGPYTADLGTTGVTLTANSGSGASVGGVDFSQALTENSSAQIAGYVEGQFDFINSRNSFAGPAYLFDNIDNIGVATFHAYRDVPNEDWGIGYRLGGLFEIESLAIDLRNDCCTARGLGGRMQVLRNGVLVYESDELAGGGNGVISASPLPQVLGDEVRYIFLDGKNTNANGSFLNFTEWIIEISDSQSSSDWYTEMAINNPSISMDIAWDTTPEAAATDIDVAGDDKANTDITFEFDEPVSHLVLHVDRLGELVDGVSNSSMWTLLTPNVTLQKVSGTSDLQVTSTTFYKSIDVATISAQGDASFQAVSGAAAGSISIVSSTPLTSLSFRVTGAGVEGNGYDVVELALSGTVCYPYMIQDFGCGEAQGSATISALGGTPPYTYLWDNMETTQTALSLDVGVHSVTITDAHDCEVVCSVEIEQDQLEVEAGNNISFCEGESGVLSPMITSDATPYGISWEGPNGFASDIESPTVTDAGIYTLTVTDANGCTATDVVEVFTFVCDNESECYYLHNFNTSLSYFGSEGALSWSDYGWDETGDNNTSNSGNIMIFNNALLMENTGSATTSIQRRIDLTGQSSAILSFDVLGEGALDAGDEFIIEVFDGTTWTTIYTHNGPISAHMPGFDISAYISAFTEIRITIVSGFEDSGERLFIDNVRIDVDCLCDGIADAGPDEVLCLGDEVQLTASGGVDYVWSPAADLSDPNVANPTASPSETTTYTVTVTDTNGCPDTDELTITVVTAPEVTVTATQDATCGEDNGFISICVTGLLPTEEVEVSLDNGLTWQMPITDCETYDGLAPGAYNVIVRKTTGECPVTLSEISILDTPVVMLDLGLEQEICPLDQATISANPSGGRPPLTYSWVGPNGYTADTEQITVSEEGLYSVTVTDADNCTDQDAVSINVLDVDGGNIELTELLCPENDPSFIISVSEPSICNFISNPEANQGLDNWVIQNNTSITPPATIAVDDTGVLSGDNSIYVDITNTTGVDEDIAIVLSGISLEAGETYIISFEASAQINRPIEVLLQNNNISLWSENVNLTTTGDVYTFTFTATEDVLDAQLVFNLGVSNASIWLDNVVVKQQSCEEPSYDYVWECRESDGAGGWTDWVVVPEANGETLDPEVLSNTKQYRRLAAAEGCITYSASNIVEIEICPCTLDAGGEEIICLGESVTLMPVASGFGTLSFLWSPSTSLSSPVAPTPIATPETTTIYSVTVTDEFGCETTGEVLVTVLVVPATTISYEDTSCDMDNGSITIDFEDLPDTDLIQFSLDGGTTWQDAVSDADGSVVYTDLANGFYDIWIRLADGSCPVDLDDVTIIEKPELMVELGEDQTLCVGETALFASTLQNGTAPFTYLWDGPGGFTSDLTTISVTDEGMYTLVVSDADGCEATDTVTLHLLDIAPGMIATPQMTCPDNDPGLIMSTVDPTACDAPGCIEPTYVYVWECRESDGAGGWTAWTTIAGAVESSYDPPVQMATKQYRRLVSAAGCDDYYISNEVEVEICPCDISVGDNQEICQGESVMLSAIATGVGEISYEWTPSESLDDPNSATPVATPEGTTTYTVTATDAIGCVISEDVTLTQLDSTVVWCERYRVRDEEGNWGEWMPMDDCTITLCEMNGLQDIEVDGGPDVNVGWVWTDEDGNPLSETDEMVTFDDIGLDDAGTYTGRLTNQDGCESVLHFDVIVNESVDASVTGVIHDYCLDSSGTATITITEGEGPFTISWQNEVGGESGTTTISEPGEYTIPGLNGGTTYCIGVEDINGCQLNP